MSSQRHMKGLEDVSKFLERWRGLRAEPWEYLCGEGQFLLRFSSSDPNWNWSRGVYVHCKDCLTVKFNSDAWENSNILLARQKQDVEEVFVLYDSDKLNVVCRQIYAYEVEGRFTLFEAL